MLGLYLKHYLFQKKIAENRFGALLKIRDKFITKLNAFSYMILLFRPKAVWEISKPYSMTLKKGSLAWKFIFCTTKVGMKLLEMGKDMEIKHSLSSRPTKYGGTFFVKKLCMVEQTVLGKFMWYALHGTND